MVVFHRKQVLALKILPIPQNFLVNAKIFSQPVKIYFFDPILDSPNV